MQMEATGPKALSLNGNTLKSIAIVAMVIDHIAAVFTPEPSALYTVLRGVGRITGPVMFYMAVEGYHHTRNIRRYVLRLLAFALISYFPFLYYHAAGIPADFRYTRLNVIFTILLGVLAVWARRELKNPVGKVALILLLICLCVPADWGTWGIAIIIAFDYFYGSFRNQAFAYTMITLLDVGVLGVLTRPVYMLVYGGELSLLAQYYQYNLFHAGMFLPLLLLYYYNGQRGGGKYSKWMFYIFYPLHLVVLGFLQYLFA